MRDPALSQGDPVSEEHTDVQVILFLGPLLHDLNFLRGQIQKPGDKHSVVGETLRFINASKIQPPEERYLHGFGAIEPRMWPSNVLVEGGMPRSGMESLDKHPHLLFGA